MSFFVALSVPQFRRHDCYSGSCYSKDAHNAYSYSQRYTTFKCNEACIERFLVLFTPIQEQ